MAMRSNGPILLSLPAFRGVTRWLILASLAVFFGLAVLSLAAHELSGTLLGLIVLQPETLLQHWQVWRLLSYPFIDRNLLSLAFALLSLWFFGSTLEEERGSRWLRDFFLTTAVGGGLLAGLLVYAAGDRIPGLSMDSFESGMWPFVLALVLAFAFFHADEPLRFNFIFTLKAKYLAAIYLLFYLGMALIGGDRFGALVALSNALCGYAYLRWAPRRPASIMASEKWFGLRNAYIRAKRRRAAKKFTVYMRRQGSDVNIDPSGRYIDPDFPSTRPGPRDPNDRKWMN
jgi:membrane associated rhomboid family serine protease